MKRHYTSIALLFFLLSLAATTEAQEARLFLQRSIQAYGAWQGVKTVAYTVSGSRDAGAQGKVYKSGEQQAYSAYRHYDLENKYLYERNLNRFPGGYAFHFATAVKDTVAYNYDIDGTRGGKLYNTGGKAVAESRYKVGNNHIAYWKVQELLQVKDSLEKVDTASFVLIRRWNHQGALVGTYHFVAGTTLLEKVTSSSGGQALELSFGNYMRQEGRMDNRLVRLLVNGKLNYEEQIKVQQVNAPFDTNLLAIPKGYTPNAVVPPSAPIAIAKDVYLIERLAGDRNVMFVNMDDYIVVIEAPVSSALSQQVIQQIKGVAPGKPIRYVFTTHYHSDHTGGLRQYVHEGAQLLMAAPTQAYVQDLLATTPPDDLGKSGRTTASLITIKELYVLEDAHHRIEFYEVPNSHAEGIALAYFPKEGLLYQGDLLSVPLDGTLPYALEVTQDLQRFLTQKGLQYTRMVGHHGHHTITPAMVQQVLQRQPPVLKE